MIKTTALATAILAATLGTVAVPASAVSYGVTIDVAPPAARVEHMPAPRRGYVWVPGYWDWTGHRHVWVAGTWVRERPGYVYAHPLLAQRNGQWVLQRGEWRHGDRDRDGIPNRMDRDRDGDGVPNAYDHRPDDPRRR